MIQDTCPRSNECPLWKKWGENCPNYVENWFTSINPKGEDGAPTLVHDCDKRRGMLQRQEIINRLIGIQKALEEQRNEFNRVDQDYTATVDFLRRFIIGLNRQLERKNGDVQALPDI